MRAGRSDAGTSGRARHARHFPPENATNDTWQYVRCNSISTDKTVFLSLFVLDQKWLTQKKETIIMKLRSELQKKYYQQVIDFHQKTGLSPHKMAKMQLFPVSVTQMYEWIAIFDAENGKGSPRRIMEAKKSKEQEELESLKSRISELEESLRVERLRNRLNEKIIDIAEARWHIEIRKKAGTKR